MNGTMCGEILGKKSGQNMSQSVCKPSENVKPLLFPTRVTVQQIEVCYWPNIKKKNSINKKWNNTPFYTVPHSWSVESITEKVLFPL